MVVASGGRKRLSDIVHLVVEASCVSFRSWPPKEDMVAVILKDMVMVDGALP